MAQVPRRFSQTGLSITTSAITDTVGLILTETGLQFNSRVIFHLDHNTTTNTIAAFRMQIRTAPTSPWITYLETTGWDAASAKLLVIQSDPVGLTAIGGTEGPVLAVVELHGAEAFRFHAQAGTGTVTDLAIHGSVVSP